MEETLNLIFRGCVLAKKLESDLPNLANQPGSLSASCEEIMGIFARAKQRLDSQNPTGFTQMIFQQRTPEFLTHEMELPAIQELRWSGSPESKMEVPEANPGIPVSSGGLMVVEMGGEVFVQARTGGAPVVDVSERGKAPAAPLVHRTRKSGSSSSTAERDKYVVRLPGRRDGNLDLPPDDGFTWRKYGQKEILHSNFPRSYYRCTHKSFHGCEAKKRVQRLNDDPSMYEVTYCGRHTCQSSVPIISAPLDRQETRLSSTQNDFTNWLLGDLEVGLNVGGTNKEPDSTLIDLADAMFNTGSSSNSIDSIFPSKRDT